LIETNDDDDDDSGGAWLEYLRDLSSVLIKMNVVVVVQVQVYCLH
jgi:hypothetical protein